MVAGHCLPGRAPSRKLAWQRGREPRDSSTMKFPTNADDESEVARELEGTELSLGESGLPEEAETTLIQSGASKVQAPPPQRTPATTDDETQAITDAKAR